MKNINVSTPIIGEEEIAFVSEILMSGNYISGRHVKLFEERFSKYIGTKYAVAVNSGTAALHLSLLAHGIGPKDEVIVPSMTFFATIEAVMYVGANPVFCDVDNTYNMDPFSIVDKITSRTKAIIPVHLYGWPCEMVPLLQLAYDYKLLVIEDAAQAHGATIMNKKVGSIGDAGCFSFFATKNMTTTEGGIITTDSEEVYETCLRLRSHGMINRHTHVELGYNYRMTEIEAAIGLVQLEKLDEMNNKRIENSEYLLDQLKNVSWIQTKLDEYKIEGRKHVYFWCPIFVLDKDPHEVISFLKEHGIEVRHRYTKPLYKQPIFRGQYNDLRLPNAEIFSGSIIGLPNHPNLSKSDLDYIIDTIKEF